MSNETTTATPEVIDSESLTRVAGGQNPGEEYAQYERLTGCKEWARRTKENVPEKIGQCNAEFVRQNWENFQPSFAGSQ